MACPDCEKYLLQGKRFCGTCGRDFSRTERCPDCEKFRAQGHSYCGTCGAALNGQDRVTSLICPDCQRYRAEGHKYCGTCGGYLMPADRPKYHDNYRLLKPCVAVACLLAIFELISAWLGVPYVFGTDGLSVELLYITPVPKLLATLTGTPLHLWYLGMCFVLTFCAIVCVKRFIEAKGRRADPIDTSFVSVPVLLGMSLIIEYAIIIASQLFTGPVEVDPDMMDISIVPSLVNASVWEELISRVLLIGLPMMVIMMTVCRADRDRPWYGYLLGGFGYSRIALVLVIFSSVFFGCAHLNWGLWKILPTIIGGLAMGYVFMKYGLHASILMHMLTDLATIPMYFGLGLATLLLFAFLLLSLPGFVVYGRRVAKDFREGRL